MTPYSYFLVLEFSVVLCQYFIIMVLFKSSRYMRCFTHHPFPHVPSLVLPWFSRPGVPVIRKSQIPPFQMCGQVPHFTSQSIRKILVVFFNFFNFRTKLSSYKFSYWWVEIFCNFFFGRTPLNNPRGYFGDFCHFNSGFFLVHGRSKNSYKGYQMWNAEDR